MKAICTMIGVVAMVALFGLYVGSAQAVYIDNFDSYTAGSGNLVGQGPWVTFDNWYGNPQASADVTAAGGIGGSQHGGVGWGVIGSAIIPIRPQDVQANGDVDITVMGFMGLYGNNHICRLVLGDEGLADNTQSLNGNRIFFNPGGDATYSKNEAGGGDTGNPKLTSVDLTSYGWYQVWLKVLANDTSLGEVGTVEVLWRDVDDTTGAPVGDGAYTSLGKIQQTYGTPSYFGFLADAGGIDNLQIIPEPGTLALLGCGLIGLLCYAWRKRK